MRILLIIAALITTLVVTIALQPSEFRMSRTAIIASSPERIFEHVNDLHKWENWSPWAKLDPNAQNTYEGPSSGVGSTLHWDGNSDVGAGIMTITESKPYQHVKFRLDFLRPFEATSTSEFTFTPIDKSTQVTWTMSGTNNFIGKAISLVMDCEKMVGSQFEQGLVNLKAQVETPSQ